MGCVWSVGELGGVHGLEAVLTAVCLQAKDKALRNRSKVAQGREKLQHAQRQEVSRGRASVAGWGHCSASCAGSSGSQGGEETAGKGEDDAGR